MDYLNLHDTVTVLTLSAESRSGPPLIYECQVYLEKSPHLIFDMNDVFLTSFQLGEMINIAKEAKEKWPGEFRGLFLVNVSKTGQQVIAQSHLEEYLRVQPSLDEAVNATK